MTAQSGGPQQLDHMFQGIERTASVLARAGCAARLRAIMAYTSTSTRREQRACYLAVLVVGASKCGV